MALSPYQQLEQEFRRLHALRSAINLLRWDAAVMLPPGSVEQRGEQLGVLETECHAVLTAPRIPRLIERASANADGLGDWQRANLVRMRREHDHAIATPNALIARLAKATAIAEARWRESKQQSDFALFAPHLQDVLDLVRERSRLLGQALRLEPYDALVDEFSPGLTTAEIDHVFATLSHRLPALIQQAIDAQAQQTVVPITAKVTAAKQRGLALELMRTLGFPFDRGRLDESEHPFTGGVPGDVRITAHFLPQDVLSGLMGVLHETGHALYFHGLPAAFRGQPVGQDAGMALHESQSLLIEMFLGRSRAFARYLQPLLLKTLGGGEAECQPDNLYRLLTRVKRSLIRIDADELTYPVHIMLRYELERELLAGELQVRDLPTVWNERMESRLGVRPANDAEGCLQDIHWALGSFGYFPSYAMGAVIAGQLWERLHQDCPGFEDEVAAGQFSTVTSWLRDNVHCLGASLGAAELVRNVTDRPLSAAAWLRHVENKYLE